MWIRNLLFVGLVLGGFAALSASLSPPRLTPPRSDRHGVVPAPTVAPPAVVAEVNAALRQQWSAAGVTPAARAPDLAILRRLSLALTGTIPSLQEIRQLEAQPEPGRLARRLDGL